MKKTWINDPKFLVFTLPSVILLFVVSIASAQGRSEDDKQGTSLGPAAVYMEILRDEGFRPTLRDSGDISFKFQGGNYWIYISDRDPTFFRLVYPNFWDFDGSVEKAKVLMSTDYASTRTKVVKLHTDDDNVSASVEMFLSNPENLRPVFLRCLSAMEAGVRKFKEKMQELK